MTKIAVIGASRGCGLETVREALARGWSVNAIARNPDQSNLKHPCLAWYKGDARNELLLEQAIRECDAVVVTLAASIGNQRVTLFSEAVFTILTVMNRLTVKRLVFLSGFGAGDSKGRGGFIYNNVFYPFFLKRNYEDKDRAEALIMKTHKDWTILRPGILSNRRRKGKVRAVSDPRDYRLGSICRSDVGAYICDCVQDHLHIHESAVITN
jgi:putative NADH-flavin reductase